MAGVITSIFHHFAGKKLKGDTVINQEEARPGVIRTYVHSQTRSSAKRATSHHAVLS
jgi:hypothetical protein